MTRALLTQECIVVTSGFIRRSYSKINDVPIVIMDMISSFLNLWQYCKISEDFLQTVWKKILKSKYGEVFVHFFDVVIGNISFGVGISASESGEFASEHQGAMKLAIDAWVKPHFDVHFIGGYFDISWEPCESTDIAFSRFVSESGRIMLKMIEHTLFFSDCNPLKTYTFAIYFDIQQIAFDHEQKENIDNLSPLKSYGQYQWIIEGERLCRLAHVDGRTDVIMDGGWKLQVVHQEQETKSKLLMYLCHPFIPFNVLAYDIRIKGICTIREKRNGKRYNLRRKAAKSRQIKFYERFSDIHKPSAAKVKFDLVHIDILKASSLTFDIEWQIIAGIVPISQRSWKRIL